MGNNFEENEKENGEEAHWEENWGIHCSCKEMRRHLWWRWVARTKGATLDEIAVARELLARQACGWDAS